ncbi:MAG: pro-sigmaK processing inhibitor BofA family protein [Clostridia bacterium]|nr:pro-sigmaK processing inhibitor BofA family protein [Clostridia bacterium]
MQIINQEILLYLGGALGVWLALRFFRKPLWLIFRILLSSLFGGILLMLLNTFGTSVGVCLAVNPVTALLSGILGVPGVLAMLFIKLWL